MYVKRTWITFAEQVCFDGAHLPHLFEQFRDACRVSSQLENTFVGKDKLSNRRRGVHHEFDRLDVLVREVLSAAPLSVEIERQCKDTQSDDTRRVFHKVA